MALNRQPNGAEKHLNFSPKVYDPVSKSYRPIYIPPDATDKVQGDVVLSDAVNGTEDAATGMTAATPKAVKTVNDNAETKVSKTVSGTQTIKSNLIIQGKVTSNTVDPGFVGNLQGDVTGNADSATKLKNKRTISIKAGSAVDAAGSAEFNGESNITIVIPKIDFNSIGVSGTIPLDNLPQGALERLIHVADQAARFSLTSANVQLGDTVLQNDTGVMYIVVDLSKLNSNAGYQEYKSGTALKAVNADVATKLGTTTVGSATKPIYLNGGTATASNSTVGSNVKPIYMDAGTITASNATIGSGTKPVYMNAGTLTAFSSNLGANNKFIYMDAGALTASTATIGSTTQPVYIQNGEIKVFPTVIPTDAKFTDTTYSVFKAANSSTAGSTGLVPAPVAGGKRFLTSEGNWDIVDAGVTGVKGDNETTYRTKQVNLTYNNIGAIGLVPDTTDGSAVASQMQSLTSYGLTANSPIRTTTGGLLPAKNSSTTNLGADGQPFNELYVNKIVGTGTTLDYTKEFGVVAIQADEPTDPNVMIWIQS